MSKSSNKAKLEQLYEWIATRGKKHSNTRKKKRFSKADVYKNTRGK